MNGRVGTCGLLLLLLTGCAGISTITPVKTVIQPAASAMLVVLTEEEKARFDDLSFPIATEPFKIAFTEQCSIIGYYTKDPLEKVVQYHTADMEYWGWEKRLSCIADETCLNFRKPSKECVITCRKEGDALRVTLFIGYTGLLIGPRL